MATSLVDGFCCYAYPISYPPCCCGAPTASSGPNRGCAGIADLQPRPFLIRRSWPSVSSVQEPRICRN